MSSVARAGGGFHPTSSRAARRCVGVTFRESRRDAGAGAGGGPEASLNTKDQTER
jgi:hypothetical protein